MEIKPKFDTSTIHIGAPVKRGNLPQKIIKDPSGVISNGIYKVIRWEKIRQLMIIIFAILILLACSILLILYATYFFPVWGSYIIPSLIALLSLYKLIVTFLEFRSFKKAIIKYKEDLVRGSTHHPPFIVKMYRQLYIKQIYHNWLTFFLLLHGGILTLILWGLKDKSWWIFEFDKWIKAIFYNPLLMQWIFTAALIAIALIHIIFAIQRKKRILDIDAYFGETLITMSDLELIKKERNKTCRRLFVGYILLVLVIPLLVKWIIKLIKRKK